MNDPIEEAKRLFAYLNGELNEEENRKMEEQIRQDERLQELVVQIRDKDYITRELTAMLHYDTAAAKAKVEERAVPTIYIVDANGKIVAMNDEIRGEKLGEKLAELFK